MRKRWAWIAGGVIVVVLGAVAFALLAGGDDGDDAAPPPTTSDLPAALDSGVTDPDATELLDLLAGGRSGSWHAIYTAGEGMILEVWRDGDRLRQDTITESNGQRIATASFATGDGTVLCTRTDDADWSCAHADGEQPAGGFVDAIATQLAGADVTARDDEVGGRSVRCFVVAGQDVAAELCVDDDGVPARIASGDSVIEVETLDTDIPGDTFDPPADPVQS